MAFISHFVFISCSVTGAVDLYYLKPTPCHYLYTYEVKGETLRIYLKSKPGVYAQVLVRERLSLKGKPNVKTLEVYVDGKLWMRERLNRAR